jgi:hypothetical protein
MNEQGHREQLKIQGKSFFIRIPTGERYEKDRFYPRALLFLFENVLKNDRPAVYFGSVAGS